MDLERVAADGVARGDGGDVRLVDRVLADEFAVRFGVGHCGCFFFIPLAGLYYPCEVLL